MGTGIGWTDRKVDRARDVGENLKWAPRGCLIFPFNQIHKSRFTLMTLIEDRYTFQVILDFVMDSDFQEIGFHRLRFHLAEVKQVTVPPEGAAEGGVSLTFQPDQKSFGLKEWGLLVKSSWNFSTIGINLVSNAPIKNIRHALPTL